MDRSLAAQIYDDVIVWEQPIQYMARDILRPGDTVFDVGGNVGGLSIAFSRIVGPNGRVVAFECNPAMIAVFKRTVDLNTASNVFLVEKAAYRKSGEELLFNLDPSFYSAASSLVQRSAGSEVIKVSTISLDDIDGPPPRLIKLDVEGAEFDVLTGAHNLLIQQNPAVILEYTFVHDIRRDPLALLEALGYTFYDTNLYKLMRRQDYDGMTSHSNVLALPPSMASTLSYSTEEVVRSPGGEPLSLQPGRWILSLEMHGDPLQPAKIEIVDQSGTRLALSMAPLQILQHHADANIVLNLDRPATVVPLVEPTSPVRGNVVLNTVGVHRVNVWTGENQ